MANITKTIYVNDSCITQSGATTKRCSAVLSGDTDCISDYTVEDTQGGTSCCSDEDEKDENVKNAKRNVKKEIKFNKTDVKGKKKKKKKNDKL